MLPVSNLIVSWRCEGKAFLLLPQEVLHDLIEFMHVALVCIVALYTCMLEVSSELWLPLIPFYAAVMVHYVRTNF